MTLALTGLLVVPVLSACSGSGGGLDGSYSVADALTELPPADGDGFTIVRTADLEAAAELGDLDPDSDEYFRQLLEDPIHVSLPLTLSGFEQDEVLGGDVGDVASFVSFQADGGSLLEVYRMPDVDLPDDSGDAGGLARRGDGERLAVAQDEDDLDAWADRDDTLADDEDFDALAHALDRRDVYSAILNRLSRDSEPDRTFAVGEAVEDGEAVEYVVYVLGDDRDGGEAADDVEQSWNETGAAENGRLEVDEADAEGDVVVVRIVPDEAGEATRALETADFPFPE